MFTVSLAPAKSETLGERRKRKAAAHREGSFGSASSTSSPELLTSRGQDQNSVAECLPARATSRTECLWKANDISVHDSSLNTACSRRNHSQDSGYDDELSEVGLEADEESLAELSLTDSLAVLKPAVVNVGDIDSLIHPGRRVSISQFPSPPLTGVGTSESDAPKMIPFSSSPMHTRTWPISPFPQQKNFSTPTGECPYSKKYSSQDTVFPNSTTVRDQTQKDPTEDVCKSLQDMTHHSAPEKICDGLRDDSDSANQDEIDFNQRIWLLSAIERLRVHAGLSTKSFGNRILCLHDSVGQGFAI